MCVIAYKPMNTAFMPESVLRECFKNNPDGAGFMFAHNGKVHIRKGYMDFDSFMNALTEVRTKYGDKIPYVMHFRISTQAGVNQQCCHPYPLSANMNDLKQLSTSADIGIAHNGIISLTSDSKVKDYNDTMKFITDYVSWIIEDVNWWKNKNKAKALEKLCGSKLAILGKDNHVELVGDFIKDKGCYYSNSTYKEPKYVMPKFSNTHYISPYYSNWEDWEEYYNKRSGKYEFEELYCPLCLDGDDSYCCECAHYKKCKTLQKYVEDMCLDDTYADAM